MQYRGDPTMNDGSARDAITQALLQISDPPPGGVRQPPAGMPPTMEQQPLGGGQTPPGGMMQPGGMMPQAPVGGMVGRTPDMQPAAFGTAPPAAGPMGPITGAYSSQVRLPGIVPQY